MRCNLRTVTILSGLVLALLAGGCQSGRLGRLQQAKDAYQQQQYQRAYSLATQFASAESGLPAEEAHYIAGISAQQMKQESTALQHLGIAARSGNAALAGDALSAIGLLHAQRGRYEAASNTLLAAADKLKGEDRAQALFHAAVSQQKLGWWPQARDQLRLARQATASEDLRQQIDSYLAITGFTLQLGAYSTPERAERHAQTIVQTTAAAQLGSPRVVPPSPGDAKPLYRVHIGQFTSYASATNIRQAYGLTDAIVVPLIAQQ